MVKEKWPSWENAVMRLITTLLSVLLSVHLILLNKKYGLKCFCNLLETKHT